MNLHTHFTAGGALKIAKAVACDKAWQRAPARGQHWLRCGLAGVGLSAAVLLPCSAQALPVVIGWEVPLSASEAYNLEVAKDAGFAQIVLTTEVKGTAFNWDAPGEGVYHWRLSRPGLTGSGADEATTFVSGSFVIVEAATPRDHPARLSWNPVPGADRYKLYLTEEAGKAAPASAGGDGSGGGAGRQRTLVTQSASFILPVLEHSVMIEVVPFAEGHRLARDFHMDPSLALASGVPLPPPAAPEAPPITRIEVIPAPLPAPVAAAADTVGVRGRVHLVYLFGGMMTESLRAQKLDLDLKSSGRYHSGGGGFWANPVAGVILSGQGDYHEHPDGALRDGKATQPVTTRLNAARYEADLGVSYNLLAPFGVKAGLLSVGGAGAVMQLPFLPVRYQTDTLHPPSFSQRQETLAGATAAAGYLGRRVAFTVEGGAMAAKTDSATLQYQRISLEFYPGGEGSHLAIILGASNRDETASRCDPSPSVCLTEGKVHLSTEERGGWLGFGGVLF